jgi:serine/threonine protein kinase
VSYHDVLWLIHCVIFLNLLLHGLESCIHGYILFRLLKALGSGEFGNVCNAVWTVSGTTKEVAVKTLKPGSSENDRIRFLQEAAIMGQFNHPHIVKLYGVVTLEDPVSYLCY